MLTHRPRAARELGYGRRLRDTEGSEVAALGYVSLVETYCYSSRALQQTSNQPSGTETSTFKRWTKTQARQHPLLAAWGAVRSGKPCCVVCSQSPSSSGRCVGASAPAQNERRPRGRARVTATAGNMHGALD